MTDDDKPLMPPEYYEDVRLMDAAARAWYASHPFAEPRFRLRAFEDDVKRRAGRPVEENVFIASALDETVIAQVAVNADGAALLRAMDKATDGRATYMQAKILIEAAIEASVRAAQGQHGAGDWTCRCCGKLLDGFTNIEGGGHRPMPGSLSICAYCGALATVNATQTGFDAMTPEAQSALPAAVKKQIHDLRNAMQRMNAERARRS